MTYMAYQAAGHFDEGLGAIWTSSGIGGRASSGSRREFYGTGASRRPA